MSKPDYKKIQATRRKTLFPLTSREVFVSRSWSAYMLHRDGHNYFAIRQILKCSGPEEARRLVARAATIFRKSRRDLLRRISKRKWFIE